jgi:hypothetical protein
MLARTAASVMGLGLVLAGTQAPAQEATPTRAPSSSLMGADNSQPARILHFTKPPNNQVAPKFDSAKQNGRRPPVSPQRTDPALRPMAFQAQPREPSARVAEEAQEYQVQLEPPGPLRLFRLESEKALQERIRQEVRDRTPLGATPERTIFPEEPVITRQPYTGRAFPPGNLVVEPIYLCYDRLLFEQKNFERYGWDLGPITPLLSAAGFYWDVVTLPYHVFTAPCRQYECSAGYCLPGSPTPLLLYPPELSLTGFLAEAGTITALFAIFP